MLYEWYDEVGDEWIYRKGMEMWGMGDVMML